MKSDIFTDLWYQTIGFMYFSPFSILAFYHFLFLDENDFDIAYCITACIVLLIIILSFVFVLIIVVAFVASMLYCRRKWNWKIAHLQIYRKHYIAVSCTGCCGNLGRVSWIHFTSFIYSKHFRSDISFDLSQFHLFISIKFIYFFFFSFAPKTIFAITFNAMRYTRNITNYVHQFLHTFLPHALSLFFALSLVPIIIT